MKYTVKPIETSYKGVLFRSRLEAKWAAFFDLLEWSWKYEPVDLRGWSPDFFIFVRRKSRSPLRGHFREMKLLAEVKPYTSVDQFYGHQCEEHLYGHPDFDCEACVGLGIDPTCCLLHLESDSEGSHGPCDFDYLVNPWPDFGMQDVMDIWAQASNAVRWVFDSQGKRIR
jgi:hypothetical protein